MKKIQLKKKHARNKRVKAKVAKKRAILRATVKYEKLLDNLRSEMNHEHVQFGPVRDTEAGIRNTDAEDDTSILYE
jgi:hypothetical protein